MKSLETERFAGPDSLRAIEMLISRVLFWGAFVAVTIATTGLAIYLVNGGLASDLQDQLRNPPPNTIVSASATRVFQSLRAGFNPLAVSELGLILLLFVPVVSVALLVPAFLKERDYRYAIIATAVLGILLGGLLLGGA
jgi:uncharacterized membrane protein